jgi:hypothetical protein
MVLGSLAIIAGFASLFLKPGGMVMVAENKIKQPGKTNQTVVTEKPSIPEEAASLKDMIQKKMNKFVASFLNMRPVLTKYFQEVERTHLLRIHS